MDIDVSRTTTADPDTVWAVLTDLEGSPSTLSLVTAVRRLDGGDDLGVGTRWEETRHSGGRDTVQTLTVTGFDPAARRYEVDVDAMGQAFASTVQVLPEGDGSRIRMTMRSTATGLAAKMLAKTLGKAFEGTLTRMMGRDLKDIAAAAEAR